MSIFGGKSGSTDIEEQLRIPLPVRSLQQPFSDEDIRNISENLAREGQTHWSKVPRIYIALRLTNHIHLISAFIDEDITDLGFPFTHRTLPRTFQDQTARKGFLEAQNLVLSKVLELEQGNKHYHFYQGSDVPLTKLSELGQGGFGFVDRVRSDLSFREYARKVIPRGINFRRDKKVLKEFENELHNLRKLSHHHIVQLVGSYTDPQFVGILMSPVADCNLKQYLEGPFEPSLVQTFFGCLAVAIRFLHENCVRHKDIKPQNVLVHRGSVLLTDFGISRDWSDEGHSTTTGLTPMSARYCAPEVAQFCPRNSSSDIWSLGCVFLEMWTAISGRSIGSLMKHLESSGTCSPCYHLNVLAIESWYNLVLPSGPNSPGALVWIRNMLKIEKEERWSAQRISDFIEEHSESEAIRFIGHCCDSNIGSPETVISIPDDAIIHNNPVVAGATKSYLSSTEDKTFVGNLALGKLLLKTTTGGTSTASSDSIPSDHNPVPLLAGRPRRSRRKRLRAPIVAEQSTLQTKRRESQYRKADQNSVSQKRSQVPGMSALYKPMKTRPSIWRKPSPLRQAQNGLPNSFLVAQNNRFTYEQVLEFIYSSESGLSQNFWSTRASCVSEKSIFCYGDYMLPSVVYAETCVRSKASQYARWKTLKSLVQHMTPAVLSGYARFCPDATEGLASIPTVVATGSASDKVHGMLIFGWHDSHTEGSRKYESKNEHDVQELVMLELQNGSSMEVEANLRVWNEDKREALTPYERTWHPLDLVDGEWYSLMPKSVTAEDENLKILLPQTSGSGSIVIDSPRVEGVAEVIQSEASVVEPQNTPSAVPQKSFNLTQDLISDFFYTEARYFVLRGISQKVIEASQTHSVWSSTPPINRKLDKAFNASRVSPIILFIILDSDGFDGIARMMNALDYSSRDRSSIMSRWKEESFRISWIAKAHIPFEQFLHVRVKSNTEGSNESTLVHSCRDGTELSQYSGIEMLRIFETFHSSSAASGPKRENPEGPTILMNPHSSLGIDLSCHRSISLEGRDGSYALTISSDGRYVAGGCRIVEVFSVDTGLCLRKFDTHALNNDEMYSASFNNDAKQLAVGGELGTIYVWDLQVGNLRGTLMGHCSTIYSLEYTSDGSRIVSGSDDKTVRVWDAHTLSNCIVLPLDEGCVTISASPDCSQIFAGTLSGKLVSWRMDSNGGKSKASVENIQVHNDSTFSVQYLPKLSCILTGSRDKTVKLWPCSPMEGESSSNVIHQPLKEFLGHKDSIYAVSASADGGLVFSASGDGSLRLWNSKTGEAIATILRFRLKLFHEVSVCQSRNMFAFAGDGGGLEIWSYTRLN